MQIPITIETPCFLKDHHFQGQPVLPAVEVMAILARSLVDQHPHLSTFPIANAYFNKFLYLQPDKNQLDAVVELENNGKKHWQASLITRSKALKSRITRTKVHAQISIFAHPDHPRAYPYDMVSAPDICQKVVPELIYKELVPFGPSFHTIVDLGIGTNGALAKIKTPTIKNHTNIGLFLGSAFAIDAAFHAACVWAQYYCAVVAFPVSIDRRWIFSPTCPDTVYFARVINRHISDGHLRFDIRVFNENSELCEAIDNVHMRDVSSGQLKPPSWIVKKQ